MRWVLLLGYSVALGAAVWARGGVDAAVWNWVGVIGLFLLGEVAGRFEGRAGPLEWWCVALLGVAGVQMVPLPEGVVGWISPLSREAWVAAGRTGWMPVTLTPDSNWREFLRLGVTLMMVLGAGRLAGLFGEKRWVAVAPVAARLAAAAYARGSSRHSASGRAGLVSAWWMVVTGCLVVGVVVSLSRMGFLATLAGMGLAVAAGVGSRGAGMSKRWKAAIGVWVVVVLVLVLGFVYLPRDELVARFAGFAQTDDITQDRRAQIWRETVKLIRAYRVLGTGLGGYEPAFLRFKTVAPDNRVDFAHNDYLPILAEMGWLGFVMALGLVRFVVRASRRSAAGWSWVEMGIAGALGALALHSLVDFNLFMPANALALGWVGGIGVARSPSLRSGTGDA